MIFQQRDNINREKLFNKEQNRTSRAEKCIN